MVIVILAAFHAREFLGTLAIGIHAGTGYEDCSPKFLLRMRQVMKTVSAGKIEIEAPLLDWLKHGIFDEADRLNVPLKLTYSSYAGTIPPGGKCSACVDIQIDRRIGAQSPQSSVL
jgi:7-cyano-7-deazaguanine synthase